MTMLETINDGTGGDYRFEIMRFVGIKRWARGSRLPHFERQVAAGNRRPALESDACSRWFAWEKALQRAQMVAGARCHVKNDRCG